MLPFSLPIPLALLHPLVGADARARRSWTGLLVEDTPVDALASAAFSSQGFRLFPSNGGGFSKLP